MPFVQRPTEFDAAFAERCTEAIDDAYMSVCDAFGDGHDHAALALAIRDLADLSGQIADGLEKVAA